MYDDNQPGRYVRRSKPVLSPFAQRIGILLLAFVLLLPIARLLDRDDGQVVRTTGLPGASVSGVATGSTAAPATIPTTVPVAATAAPPTQAAAAAPAPAVTAAKQPAVTAAKKPATAAKKAPATTAKAKAPATTVAKPKAPATTAAKAPATTAKPKPVPTTAAPAPAPPPASYTVAEVESIIRQVWPDELEDHAIAIAKRESKLIPTSRNYCCYGLFAIYYEAGKRLLNSIGVTNANQLLDPWVNTRAALAIYQAAGWDPWKL